MVRCPVCTFNCNIQHMNFTGNASGTRYACSRCGTYHLGDGAIRKLEIHIRDNEINRSLLSHQIRKMQSASERGNRVVFYERDLESYFDQVPPVPQEQANNLILWIGSQQGERPDNWASSKIRPLAAIVGSAVSPSVPDEPSFQWLLEHQNAQLFDTTNNAPDQLSFRLTMKGWSVYEELMRRKLDSKKAFMAMKFDDTTMDNMLNSCFKPSAKRAGFSLFALNQEQPAGLIDNQIRAAIRSARFVVADLTHVSNGAYFEAGFAEGLGLPVMYTCEHRIFQEKRTHFDTNHMVTIPWEADKPDIAGRLLTATIRATLPAESKLDD
jgi:hypothetical protein